MRTAVNIARVVVGLLFIFSGLVKANDPLGLSYKMQEFFELWGMTQFNSTTLMMSVLMNAFEIIAGFALLLGWRIKLFSWLLLLLIVFFTFLTGYAHFSGKFRNCGCFGDCLPISAKTSFIKDLLLLLLISFLFWKRHLIQPLFSNRANTMLMLGITAFSFVLQWYTLTYLPFADCLPFKKGNNITEKMKIPAGAKPDSLAIRFVYEKGGKQFEFSPVELPADLATYKFVSRKDKLIRKGNAEPPIKGFTLNGAGNDSITGNRVDSTAVVLSQPHAILLFCEDFSVSPAKWRKEFEEIYSLAKKKNVPSYLVTAQPDEAIKAIAGTGFSDIQVFSCDNVAIRTAARTNPCLFIIKQGTVLGKWSHKKWNNARAELNKLP